MGWRSRRLGPWPLQLKLGLALSNGRATNGTNNREVSRLRIGDRRMVNDPRDSKKKNEFITGCRILLNIYKGEYEMRGKVNGMPLKKG